MDFKVHPSTNKLDWPPAKLSRFISRISFPETEEGCWGWTGYHTLGGYAQYGMAKKGEKSAYAHRICYELAVAEVPSNWHLHHECHNRGCVNPTHLTPITAADHVRTHTKEWAAQGKYVRELQTHCKAGHEFTPENTILRYDGKRACRICTKEWAHTTYRSAHLEPTPKTHCKRGHELRTHVDCHGEVKRFCHECKMDAIKRYQQTPKGQQAKARAKAKELQKLREKRTAASAATIKMV